jgi:hypothetical protein
VDEDRLSPQLGRLIDAAKAAARAGSADQPPGAGLTGGAPTGAAAPNGAAARAEGWSVLGIDGDVYAGGRLAAALAAAAAGGTAPEAAAFAVVGEQGETLLPAGAWRQGAQGVDPQLPVVVKYLGRWVLVCLEELPAS